MKRVMLIIMVLMIPMVNAATEQEICDSVYYFIAENNHQYNQTDLDELGETLNITDPTYYISNYDFICYDRGISDKLPMKFISPIKVSPITQEVCDSDPPRLLNDSIPMFNIGVGDVECKTAKRLSYVFRVQEDDSYKITGVRIWWMASILMLGMLSWILKAERKLNKVAYSQ